MTGAGARTPARENAAPAHLGAARARANADARGPVA